MNKRPKSREETPKEGSDSARRYRTATICDRDAQSARAFDAFHVQKSTPPASGTKKSHVAILDSYFSWLRHTSSLEKGCAGAVNTTLSNS